MQTMKTFSVELKRISYVTVFVTAIDKEAAEDMAWKELQTGESHGLTGDADWNIESIEQLED